DEILLDRRRCSYSLEAALFFVESGYIGHDETSLSESSLDAVPDRRFRIGKLYCHPTPGLEHSICFRKTGRHDSSVLLATLFLDGILDRFLFVVGLYF